MDVDNRAALGEALGAAHSGSMSMDLAVRKRFSRPTLPSKIDTTLKVPTHMTPPETPHSPRTAAAANVEQQEEDDERVQNYLRAFYLFDPSLHLERNCESSLITICIKPGDLILVHSIHENGWADGTVLATGERGWLPTNYCEAFDHPFLRNLLNAMTQCWDLLGADGEDANLATFLQQDYIRGLIAGVRHLLENADCLHREAPLVKRHAGIRRTRKGLLADLSTLVQIAKRLQEMITEPFAGEVIHVLLDDLIAKAFKVMTRAVGFVDIWTHDTAIIQPDQPSQMQMPATPPVDVGSFQRDYRPTPDSPQTRPGSAKSVSTSTTGIGRSFEHTIEGAEEPPSPNTSRTRRTSGFLSHRKSVASCTSSFVDEGHRGKVMLASEHLAGAHDVCISHIGAFIGLHLQSRPALELFDKTRRLVKAGKRLLAIVNAIHLRDYQRAPAVPQAMQRFQSQLHTLVRNSRNVAQISGENADEMFLISDRSDHLVILATRLIRCAGDCASATRRVLESIGDFEIERPSSRTKLALAGVPVARDFAQPAQPTSNAADERRSLSPLGHSADRRSLSISPGYDGLEPATPADAALAQKLRQPGVQARSLTSHRSLPSLPGKSLNESSNVEPGSDHEWLRSPRAARGSSASPVRKDSIGISVAESVETYATSARDSSVTGASDFTRATTPDRGKEAQSPDFGNLSSFASLPSLRSVAEEQAAEADTSIPQKTFTDELMTNSEGQVIGGSLPALVEQLTRHNTAPDPLFITAFFVTFRRFTTARIFAQALIERFEYANEDQTVASPARLRIYNVFKMWLETHWNAEADKDALGEIRYFALHKLKLVLASAGQRLVDLTRRVTAGYHLGIEVGPLVSGIGKTSTSLAYQLVVEGTVPEPIITKNQLSALRLATSGHGHCSVLDFDPLELARQITLMTSKTFCGIAPDELLSLDWGKEGTRKAPHVRTMCLSNTDLAHMVGDTILGPDEAKRRALVIKQWSKVAVRCLELSNYDSLMAIMCSINSSVIQRLRRTWELVSRKTKTRLGELNSIIDVSRNYVSLRRRLESPVAPCIPFLGIYLTDLTFLEAGNPKTRELPGRTTETGEPVTVINFDKHMRMAKVVSHLQKFQIPYKLEAVSEMQGWIQAHLDRMRESPEAMLETFQTRSLSVEPRTEDFRLAREAEERRQANVDAGAEERPRTAGGMERLENLLKMNNFGF